MEISWEVLYGLGAAVLGIFILWGVRQDRKRTASDQAVTETATALLHQRFQLFGAQTEIFDAGGAALGALGAQRFAAAAVMANQVHARPVVGEGDVAARAFEHEAAVTA